ncbi:MAG: transglycosylase SLT domain-containing protein [Azoarcus sp.]|jgi:soluble lytic murein transglycosylase|nr:transglycosylase SLT domain-containing protein [Azoarcus sp.]
MPTVPTYNDNAPSVGLNQPTANRFHAAVPSVDPSAQHAQLAGVMTDAGRALFKIENERRDEMDNLRLDDAAREVRQKAIELQLGQDGYGALQGAAALPKEGKALSDEYTKRLDEFSAEVSRGLGNDRQRAYFEAFKQKELLRFKEGAMRHEHNEAQKWKASASQAIIAQAADEIIALRNDPEAVETASRRAIEEAERFSSITGMHIDEARRKAKGVVSAAHSNNLNAMIDEGDLVGAVAYFNQFNGGMEHQHKIKDNITLSNFVEDEKGIAFGSTLISDREKAYKPNDFDRVLNITAQSESGNRDFIEGGQPVRSPVGAMYKMQVMPDTAKKPGHGIKPAQNDTPEEYNRVGSELLAALVDKYGGNIGKAWAAYNAGEKWVDAAVSKAKKAEQGTQESDWFWQLNNDDRTPDNRKQTKDYVEKNMRLLGSGGGRPARPTLEGYIEHIDASGLSSRARKRAIEYVKERHTAQNDAVKQEREEAKAAAIRYSEQTGLKFDELPMSIREAIHETDRSSVKSQIEALRKGPTDPDPAIYVHLITNHDVVRSLTDAEMTNLKSRLGNKFDEITKLRANLINNDNKDNNNDNKDNNKGIELLSHINLVVRTARKIGILNEEPEKNEKEKPEFIEFMYRVQEEIYEFKAINGRTATGKDLDEILNRIVDDKVMRRDTFSPDNEISFYKGISEGEQGNLYIKLDDGREVRISSIPIDFVEKIKSINPNANMRYIAKEYRDYLDKTKHKNVMSATIIKTPERPGRIPSDDEVPEPWDGKPR